jgi:hypothetical protein
MFKHRHEFKCSAAGILVMRRTTTFRSTMERDTTAVLQYRVCANYWSNFQKHIFTNTEKKFMMLPPFVHWLLCVWTDRLVYALTALCVYWLLFVCTDCFVCALTALCVHWMFCVCTDCFVYKLTALCVQWLLCVCTECFACTLTALCINWLLCVCTNRFVCALNALCVHWLFLGAMTALCVHWLLCVCTDCFVYALTALCMNWLLCVWTDCFIFYSGCCTMKLLRTVQSASTKNPKVKVEFGTLTMGKSPEIKFYSEPLNPKNPSGPQKGLKPRSKISV